MRFLAASLVLVLSFATSAAGECVDVFAGDIPTIRPEAEYISPVSQRKIDVTLFEELKGKSGNELVEHLRAQGVLVVFVGDSSEPLAYDDTARLADHSQLNFMDYKHFYRYYQTASRRDDEDEGVEANEDVVHVETLGIALQAYEDFVDPKDRTSYPRPERNKPAIILRADPDKKWNQPVSLESIIQHEFAHLLFDRYDPVSSEIRAYSSVGASTIRREQFYRNIQKDYGAAKATKDGTFMYYFQMLGSNEERLQALEVALSFKLGILEPHRLRIGYEGEVMALQIKYAKEFGLSRNEYLLIYNYASSIVTKAAEEFDGHFESINQLRTIGENYILAYRAAGPSAHTDRGLELCVQVEAAIKKLDDFGNDTQERSNALLENVLRPSAEFLDGKN